MCLCMNVWMVLQKLWNILWGKTRKPKGSLGNISSFCPPLHFFYRPNKRNDIRDSLACWWHCRDDFSRYVVKRWQYANEQGDPWCVVYVVKGACECLTDHLFSRCGSEGRCRNCKCLFDLRALGELSKGSSPTGLRIGVLRKGLFCNRPMWPHDYREDFPPSHWTWSNHFNLHL